MKKYPLCIGFGLAAIATGAALLYRQRRQRARRWNEALVSAPVRTALVTGASSGIGAAYARRLAALGYRLVLVARREARLQALAEELHQQFGTAVEVLPADLSTTAGIDRVESRILAQNDIDFLVNNAGFAIFGDFARIPFEEQSGLINCYVMACTRFSRAALPGMLSRHHGVIVNVSSIGGLLPKPKDVVYCSSKAYLVMFTQALHMELAHTQVRVQALCPGFTWTEFHDHPQYAVYHIKETIPSRLWMQPEEVVAASLQALAENRVVCIPGWMNQAFVAAGRLGLTNSLLSVFSALLRRSSQPAALKPASVDLLACPSCHSALELQNAPAYSDLVTATLYCQHCKKTYPIENGIPRFVNYKELTGLNRRFAYLYDWFSYVYRAFSKIAFAFIGSTEEKSRHEVLDRLELNRLAPQGGKVLEVSIGPGVNLPFLVGAPGVAEIYGLDISLGQLRHCQDFVRQRGWSVDLFHGNAEELPFQDNSFDSVFHIGGINFFTNKEKAIREMIRVAKPGTRIVIADETERGAHGYELTLPGFKKSFKQAREEVKPPVNLVPPEMEDVHLDLTIWGGWFYCLDFRKPA